MNWMALLTFVSGFALACLLLLPAYVGATKRARLYLTVAYSSMVAQYALLEMCEWTPMTHERKIRVANILAWCEAEAQGYGKFFLENMKKDVAKGTVTEG